MTADRPQVTDHQPKAGTCDGRRMPIISESDEDMVISSSCGWGVYHPRRKVRGDMAERHLDKRHDGKGLWF